MFAHADLEVYQRALDLAVLIDELAEQLPPGEDGRGDGMMVASRHLARAVARAANGTGGTSWDEVRDAVANTAFELDIFQRRAFVTGVDEARGQLVQVARLIPAD